jgi:hypothetical protein
MNTWPQRLEKVLPKVRGLINYIAAALSRNFTDDEVDTSTISAAEQPRGSDAQQQYSEQHEHRESL